MAWSIETERDKNQAFREPKWFFTSSRKEVSCSECPFGMGQKALGLTAGRETQVKHQETLAKVIKDSRTQEDPAMRKMAVSVVGISEQNRLFLSEASSVSRQGTEQIRGF